MAIASTLSAQGARVTGFVTDESNGANLAGATVALYLASDQPSYGTASQSSGAFLIPDILPGTYEVRISFVGFETHRDTLVLGDGEVRRIRVSLQPGTTEGQEVLIETERTSGGARITAGAQKIVPSDIEMIPAPGLSADLAAYLTSLPGIVSTGDRGGQFFVRGGEPTQNLTTLDDIVIFQPFHVVGGYSAMPSDMIDQVDFHAGGFGAQYAGRLSSVIDVSARPGNNQRFGLLMNASPFVSSVRLEGPIIRGRMSAIAIGRASMIEQVAPTLYGQELPLLFRDGFFKIHATPGTSHVFSLTGLQTFDRGGLTSEINSDRNQLVDWTNTGLGLKWTLLPKSLPVIAEFHASHSVHEMRLGEPNRVDRSSRINATRFALQATFMRGELSTHAGWDVVLSRARNDLDGLFQNIETSNSAVPSVGLFVEPEYQVAADLRIRLGLRGQTYNVRHLPYLEPRLRLIWEPGTHTFSAAVARMYQQIIGVTDRRDAASIFTAWSGIPRQDDDLDRRLGDDILRGRINAAWHFIAGYRTTPSPTLEFSTEAYYKTLSNLFVSEWSALPRLTTRFQQASGRSLGGEARAEWRPGRVTAFVTYGLSSTTYYADGAAIKYWFGIDRLAYRPAHDRRHQVNAVLSADWGDFQASARWAFGSGLPYTRPLAYDGFALVDDIKPAEELEHSRRVIFERPFDSVLPTYHRLDVSAKYTRRFTGATVTAQASLINAYDRPNIFFVDVFTLERQDQLPRLLTLGLQVEIG